MKDINLTDLSEWLNNKTRKKIDPIKREAEKKVEKCESIFDELKIACKKLEEQEGSTTDELVLKSAKRFSEKLIDRLNEVEFPEKITYEELDNFKTRLESLLTTVAHYANRWVSKLGRDKKYLQNIRDINYLLKDIQNLYAKLYNFLDNKYKKVVNIENLEELIERLTNLMEEAKDLKVNESEIKKGFELKESELKQLNAEINDLEKDEIINKLKTLNGKLDKLNGTIRNIIGPIRKPLRKFSKLVDDGEFNLRIDSVSYVNAYLNSPIKSFLKENDEFLHLKSVLLDLGDAISNNKLKLKSGYEKKIKAKIDQIESKNLIKIKMNHEKLSKEKENLISNPEYNKKIQILEELKQKEETLQRELDEINLKLDKNLDDYNKALNKIGDYKTKIENSVFELTNTQIKLQL